KFRYASRYIIRSASESSSCVVPDCGMHWPPPLHAGENAATGIVVGPVSVEFAGVVQSVWKRQRRRLFVPKATRSFGEPTGGGGVDPSRSDGRRPPYAEPSWKHCCVADNPCSIRPRSHAHTCEPWNELLRNMLNVT